MIDIEKAMGVRDYGWKLGPGLEKTKDGSIVFKLEERGKIHDCASSSGTSSEPGGLGSGHWQWAAGIA
jgi:hypothetical protein